MDSLADYFHFSDLSLRIAGAEDIPVLVELVNDAYAYQDHAKGAPRTDADQMAEYLQRTSFYVITEHEAVIACVYLERVEEAAHFGLLAVVPEYRGRGIAHEIMRAIEAYSKSLGCAAVELDYMSLAPWLKSYYEGCGYQETGDTIARGAITLIKMRKPLE
jgi:N-acetylglutamate synthase-like GNAT family acetyltransferase